LGGSECGSARFGGGSEWRADRARGGAHAHTAGGKSGTSHSAADGGDYSAFGETRTGKYAFIFHAADRGDHRATGAGDSGSAEHWKRNGAGGQFIDCRGAGGSSRIFLASFSWFENESAGAGGSPQTLPVAPTPEPKPISYPRYAYHSIAKPANGDRRAATQASADGWRAQQAKQLSEAATAYRKAIQLDPSYFDAYFNLGALRVNSSKVAVGLAAYETALAIEPDSAAARFNFAVALSKANYPIDAAGEFEKMLAKSPTDANAVWAHFAAGNLYANQLRQPARAREHYQKVLELNPNFPQAGMIRSWLGANP